MKNIAIIPARGGSKRIPRKNIKPFLGKPIIAYSIEAAIQSGLFDTVIVSTDDVEIAEVAKKYGAQVPFLRSKDNSNDFADLKDVLLEVEKDLKALNYDFDTICCILPTAPFVNESILLESYERLVDDVFSLFPVVKFSYPIQRALKAENGNISMVEPKYISSRSQDLEDRFHDVGLFYWIKRTALIKEKTLFTSKCAYIEYPEKMVQDIDTQQDWDIAEMKYKMLGLEK